MLLDTPLKISPPFVALRPDADGVTAIAFGFLKVVVNPLVLTTVKAATAPPGTDPDTVVLKFDVAPAELTDCDHEPDADVAMVTVIVQVPPEAMLAQVFPVKLNGAARPESPVRVIAVLPPFDTVIDAGTEPEFNVRLPNDRLPETIDATEVA